jgi:uncharacterized membrane protein
MDILLAILIPLSFWVFRWLEIPFWYVGFFLIPLIFLKKNPYWGKLIAFGASSIGFLTLISQNDFYVYLYPVAINVIFLFVFGFGLFYPPTIIERIARVQDSNFSDADIPYVKKCTVAWCIFFLINGSISLYLAFLDEKDFWALYSGLISYILMACMFLGEWLIRQKRIRNVV